MTKKNKSYWIERQKQWIKNQDKADTALSNKLKRHYQKTAKEIEKDIAVYYQKYGEDNIIEFRTMMKRLDKADRDLLFQSMDEFADKYPDYKHLMPVRESVYKLNRLQGLSYSTQMQLLELGVYEQMEMEKYLEGVYATHYSNMAKELGMGTSFSNVNSQTIRDTIFTKWVSGENFSDRIWSNKNKLLSHLTTKYRDGLARGDNYDKLSKAITDRFGVGAYDAKRLVWTESSFVLNQAHAQPYEDAGVKEYEINAIMDSRTSDICRNLDGERFKFKGMEVGENHPPFHPWCRTVVLGVDLDKILD